MGVGVFILLGLPIFGVYVVCTLINVIRKRLDLALYWCGVIVVSSTYGAVFMLTESHVATLWEKISLGHAAIIVSPLLVNEIVTPFLILLALIAVRVIIFIQYRRNTLGTTKVETSV